MSVMARILIVDDIDDNRYTLRRRLTRQGFEDIDEAENGREALEKIETTDYDLVLLDIMMPEVDGYQVLETLEADGRIGEPPVIMISALDEMDSIVRCITLGAEDYLPKPFNATLLKARIGAVLQKKQLRDAVKESHDRMQKELDAARRLQLGMVPKDFPSESAACPVAIHATMTPAREVGGDLYDAFFPRNNVLCFVIGDVSDKGTPAALFMARTRSVLRLAVTLLAERQEGLPEPSEILRVVNVELCQNNAERMFVTLFLGFLDLTSGTVRFANAGHPAPLRLTAQGVAAPDSTPPGPPLGVSPRLLHATREMQLAPGEALFMLSDGVTDATDPAGAFFGEARLIEALGPVSGATPRAAITAIEDAVAAHVAGGDPFDDVTMLMLRWRP